MTHPLILRCQAATADEVAKMSETFDPLQKIAQASALHKFADLVAENERLREALRDALATLSAVRATASSDDWAGAAKHFYDLIGAELPTYRAALEGNKL